MSYLLVISGITVIVSTLIYYFKEFKAGYKENASSGRKVAIIFYVFEFISDLRYNMAFLILIGLALITLGLGAVLDIF